MVQANVGQKLLTRHILRVFSCDRKKVSSSGFKITNYYKRNSETTPPYVILITNPSPNKLYTHLKKALLFHLIYNTPIENRGLSINLWPFVPIDDKRTQKQLA
jgi:hypothetical protein